MKLSFCFIATLCFVTSNAHPGLVAPVLFTSSQYHSQDQLGQYSYGYSNPQSAKAEVKTADGITQGSYSYVDAEGKLQSVHYTSDEVNGFRVAASNLPTSSVPIVPLVSSPIALHTDPIEEISIKSKSGKEEKLIQLANHDSDQQAITVDAKPKDALQPLLKTSLLTYASPIIPTTAHFAPGFTYSYGYVYPQYAYLNHLPGITTYTAPVIAAHRIAAIPAVPAETPEVLKARTDHIKAHEEAKARHLR